MAFNKKTWKDRVAEFINRRLLTKEDGSTELVTVARSEGAISVEGDAFNAETMNDLEDRVEAAFNEMSKSKQDAATAINTGNIGKQSVSHASSADSATNASKVPWSGVQGKPSTYPPAAHEHQFGSLELIYTTPFIDFHYNSSKADYTTRIIDDGSGLCFLNAEGDNFKYGGKSGHSIAISSKGEFVAYNDHVVMRADTAWFTTRDGAGFIPVYGQSFTNPSSKLVKENINGMSDEEAKKVLQLNPVTFDYIKEFGGACNQRGLIAEEVLETIPSCVSVPENYSEEDFDIEKGIGNEVLAIDYSKLVPYLIKMVQIQQKEIEKLKEAMNKEGGK